MIKKMLGHALYTTNYLVDCIFPPTPHEHHLRTWTAEEFSSLLQPTRLQPNVVSLSDYRHPAIQAAIQATKFEQSHLAAGLLSTLISLYISTLPQKKTLIIPIPLSPDRERRRGFNQVTRVIEHALKRNKKIFVIAPRLLYRIKNTVPQTTLKRADRLKNVVGIFDLEKAALEKTVAKHMIEKIIICDDVLTTGATINNARTTVAPHLPKHIELLCVTWAH